MLYPILGLEEEKRYSCTYMYMYLGIFPPFGIGADTCLFGKNSDILILIWNFYFYDIGFLSSFHLFMLLK